MFSLSRLLYPPVAIRPRKALEVLDGKTILISGATFGIGEALSRQLMHYHVHLLLVARTREKLELLKTESVPLPATVDIFPCDFCIEESISELCKKLESIQIDYFVSNAGKSVMRSLKESKARLDDYVKTIAINYLSPVQLILKSVENFARAKTHIVNVSTYNVLMKTPPKWSAYVSSKKAMHSWFQSNSPELAAMNITVSNIYLPLVESRMKEANKLYKNTPAMRMNSAVAVIIKGMIDRDYHFKPWWHIPLQIVLLVFNPFWQHFWIRRTQNEK